MLRIHIKKLAQGLFVLFTIAVLGTLLSENVLAARNNPPGRKGGSGTNWANPPGPQGGPGTSKHKYKKDKYWWKTATPYQKWERAQLIEHLEELKEYRSELMASGADPDLVIEVNEEIDEIEDQLNI